jgi:CheY-like chemotaxis protein
LTAASGTPAFLELRTEARGTVNGTGVRVVDGERVSLTFLPEVAGHHQAAKAREPESRHVTEVVREAHDALTGVVGFAGLAQIAPTPHRRKFYLDQVATQADRVRRLIQAIDPAFATRMPLIHPVNLGMELARAVSGTRQALERNGVAFDMVQPSHSTWASCDVRQVCDMVVALVLRATTEKRREYQANEVTVSVEPAPGVVRVVMLFAGADNPSLVMREEFGSGEEPHTPQAMGTGELELRAGQAALAKQGGTFEVIREPELEEVRVVLTVPAAPAARVRDELRTPVPLEILAIEDDPMVGELYTELLAVSGHTVTAVKSVVAARDMLRNQRFDAVLSEFHLRDGLLPELWAMASEAHPELKSRLLVVTRDPRDARLIEWAGENRTPILAKPFHSTALLDQVALLSS